MRHDLSVSSQRYFAAVRADGSIDTYTFPGTINYGIQSSCYQVVPPQPFADWSPILPQTFSP